MKWRGKTFQAETENGGCTEGMTGPVLAGGKLQQEVLGDGAGGREAAV